MTNFKPGDRVRIRSRQTSSSGKLATIQALEHNGMLELRIDDGPPYSMWFNLDEVEKLPSEEEEIDQLKRKNRELVATVAEQGRTISRQLTHTLEQDKIIRQLQAAIDENDAARSAPRFKVGDFVYPTRGSSKMDNYVYTVLDVEDGQVVAVVYGRRSDHWLSNYTGRGGRAWIKNYTWTKVS